MSSLIIKYDGQVAEISENSSSVRGFPECEYCSALNNGITQHSNCYRSFAIELHYLGPWKIPCTCIPNKC